MILVVDRTMCGSVEMEGQHAVSAVDGMYFNNAARSCVEIDISAFTTPSLFTVTYRPTVQFYIVTHVTRQISVREYVCLCVCVPVSNLYT